MNDMIEAKFTQVSERSLDTITAEIITITRQTQTMILQSAIEVGRRLCEAKEQVPHGEWGDYLKNRVDFSPSSANNFMRIFKEYGDDQIDLFGASKSQTFGNLSYSKAVALFAVPEEEREEFMQQNDVENISVAELKRLIAERDAELTDARREKQMACENIELLRNELSNARRELNEKTVSEQELENIRLEAQVQAECDAKAAVAGEIDRIKADAEAERNKYADKAAKLEAKLKKAKADAAAEAEKAVAAEKAKIAELEKQINEAKNADKSAAKELEKARERAEQLEKKLKLSDSDSTKFSLLFEELQETFNKLMGLMAKIEISDAERSEKLKGALRSVLKSMEERT